jgi:hypothetical protein
MNRRLDATLRWAALIVTDRRWAAPLSALALGFGLFVGVAIGPSTAGSLATGGAQIIEIPGLGGVIGGGEGGDESGGSSTAFAGPAPSASEGGGGATPSSGAAFPSLATVPSGESTFAAPTLPAEQPSAEAVPDTALPDGTGPSLAVADAVVAAAPDAPTASECADLTAILVQIYVDDPVGLPYGDSAGLQAALCPPS